MFMENRRELSQIYEHEVHTRVLFMNQMSQIEFPTFGEYKFLILSFEQLNLNFIFTQNILIYDNIQCKNKINKQVFFLFLLSILRKRAAAIYIFWAEVNITCLLYLRNKIFWQIPVEISKLVCHAQFLRMLNLLLFIAEKSFHICIYLHIYSLFCLFQNIHFMNSFINCV